MFIQSSSPVDTEKDLRSTAANDNKSAIDLEKDFGHVVQALEQIETKLRIQYVPSLIERAPALEFDDIKENNSSSDNNQNDSKETPSPSSADGGVLATIDGTTASLRRRNLKHFSLSMFPTNPTITLDQLTILDVSHNELMELPGLSSLTNLLVLNLERNWFNTLPTEIGCCTKLQQLLAGRNFLRPNTNSLLFPQLQKLKCLKVLDLVYNQKCGRPHHRDVIRQALQLPDGLPSGIEINLTLWEEVGNVPGTYIGKCAAERNPTHLRSQLEPWGTVQLRKRLVQDFGHAPTNPAVVDRAQVMSQLLRAYQQEGLLVNDKIANRHQLYLDGIPVPQSLIDKLLLELRAWTKETGLVNKGRERPSIHASNYMILRAKKEETSTTSTNSKNNKPSRRALCKAKKLEKYKALWDLAKETLQGVDPGFAERCTEIAVTYGFQGSPHIDKQNCGPFYGLALGEFVGGEISVECSARVVAVVNTKHRLGRVDGRYPHWVNPYEVESSERYSLIYYETGSAFVKPGPAIFDLPRNESSSFAAS